MTDLRLLARHPVALFRTDANVSIGTGHLTRSLALADELAVHGWHAIVASRGLSHEFRTDVRARGHEVLEIAAGIAPEDEPEQIVSMVKGGAVDLTVTDSYEIAAPWQQAVRNWSRFLMAIDDLANARLDVDLLLNQNVGEAADKYANLIPDEAELLIGPEYALLRPQFRASRGDAPRIRRSVKRLFVFISGADEPDVTGLAAAAAARTGIPTDVVIGAAYPHEARLRAALTRARTITLHRNVADIARLMSRADLAIGAPSSASWERCCVGLPSILITLAPNQVRAGAALAQLGAAVNLGWYTNLDVGRLAAVVQELVDAPERLAAMSRAASGVTDGHGAERVRRVIERLTGEGGRTNA